MEISSELNTAHRLARQADKLVKQGKHQQAIDVQVQVVEALRSALKECEDKKVSDCINLQIQYHQREQQVIKLQEARFQKITKNLQNLQKRMENASLQDAHSLEDSIYRTFKETESLLENLKHAQNPLEDKSPTTGAKMPKDDKEIIEELQTANNHLRAMVETMFLDLETYRKENAELKSRVADLEAEKCARNAAPPVSIMFEDALQDSAGDLPPLAPLEVPHFDFSVNETQN